MATKKRRLLKLLVFLLLVGSVGAAVYFNLRQEKAEETYATALVEQGAVVDKLAETGRIELVRTVEVKSTIAGEIRDLPIEAGAWVETGELMAVIEPDPNQSLQLYQKRSSVEQGKIDLAEQERNFERQKALFDSKMIPAKQFEEAEVRLTRARTGLRLAHSNSTCSKPRPTCSGSSSQKTKSHSTRCASSPRSTALSSAAT